MNLQNKKKKKHKITQVIFIIDESGSMFTVKNETITGINEQIQALKQDTSIDTRVTFVTFNYDVKFRYENIPISDINEITEKDYEPMGLTALNDAIVDAVSKEKAREYESADVSRLIVIVTDGLENASKEYSKLNDGCNKVADILKDVQAEGWTISYLGANQDLTEVKKSYGLKTSNIASYTSNSGGTKNAFTSTKNSLTAYMSLRKVVDVSVDKDTLSKNFYSKNDEITKI